MVTLSYDGSDGVYGFSGPAVFDRQKTLAGAAELSGTGLHSGNTTKVVMHPAPENTGIVFRDGNHEVEGLVRNVVDTARGTTIGYNGMRVRTIEHLMAALRGMGVDNAYIEVSGPETPALDGSAFPYVMAIREAGVVEQRAERKLISLPEPVWVRNKDSFICAAPAPYFRITYVLNYDHPMIGCQSVTYEFREGDFGDEIAPARTFVLFEEVEPLLNSGLSRGGTIDNVIVVWKDRMSTDLRFADELVRHKVMDLVGDLSLVGGLLQAEVLAVKSGHTLNVEFAKEVDRLLSEQSSETAVREAV